MKDPLYPELDEEPTPEDEPAPDDVAAEDEEAGEDDPKPLLEQLTDIRIGNIPDGAF